MPEESLTPEERLLRLIRRKGSAPSQVAKTPQAAEEAKGKPSQGTPPPPDRKRRFPSLATIGEALSFLYRRRETPLSKGLPLAFGDPIASSYFFMRIEQILLVLVGIVFLFFIGSRAIPRKPLTTTALLEGIPLSGETSPSGQVAVQPYEYYGEVIEKRNLFQPGLPAKEGSGTAPSVATGRLKDLALIGIISGKNPQAIIEDKKDQKTYFLRIGEMLGELRVEQILEEKVTLSYEGEQFDLVL